MRPTRSRRPELELAVTFRIPPIDNLVERSNRVLNLAAASPRDILSLQNWAAGTASLARDETAYLLKAGDLFSAAPATDDACAHIEPLLETLASRVYERFCKVSFTSLSNPLHHKSSILISSIPGFLFHATQASSSSPTHL